MFFEPQESRAIVLTDTVCVHTQLRLTICDPMDCSQSGSSVHGISQARILECYYWLLQGFFLTQGLNPSLLHWQADSEGSNKSTIIFISLSLCDDFHLFFSLWKSITTTPRLVKMDIQIATLCLYWHLLLPWWFIYPVAAGNLLRDKRINTSWVYALGSSLCSAFACQAQAMPPLVISTKIRFKEK